MPVETTAESHVKYLFDLLSKQNDSTYIGERISQLAHSLQAAHLAVLAKDPASNEEMAIAALLHDIGQILPLEEKNESRKHIKDTQAANQDMLDENGVNVGRVGHEKIGEDYLRSHGWPENVCQLVGAHVIAKRYLATSPEYLSSLSRASRSSLKQQGGPFSAEEKENFETSDPIWRQKITLRQYDDSAKVIGRQTRELQQWWPVALRVYQGRGLSTIEMVEVEEAECI